MDGVANIINHELHRLLVDGIKYERIGGSGPEAEWEMLLFKNEELINYLTALKVKNSVYEYVVYDSEVEREFAQPLRRARGHQAFCETAGMVRSGHPGWKIQPGLGYTQA